MQYRIDNNGINELLSIPMKEVVDLSFAEADCVGLCHN